MITEKLRVPIAIFTGTPDTSADSLGIPIYKKGEANQEEIVTELCEISDTGLFSVITFFPMIFFFPIQIPGSLTIKFPVADIPCFRNFPKCF